MADGQGEAVAASAARIDERDVADALYGRQLDPARDGANHNDLLIYETLDVGSELGQELRAATAGVALDRGVDDTLAQRRVHRP